jgi:hypothetical protein
VHLPHGSYYDYVLLKSKNKIKTTWSIIKRETGYKNHKKELQELKINNIIIKDKGRITNAFNEYFSSVAQTIIEDLNKDNYESLTNIDPLYYLDNSYNSSYEH